jgi:uncharacterized iron-regulated membrane protein
MRKLIFKAHMYVGLCAGLLLALMGLTGSMLVFGDELDRFFNPSLLSVEPGGEKVSVEAVIKSVRQAYPSEKVARIRFPHDREGTYELCFEAKTDARCVYVDPYSAAVLGSRVPSRSFKGRLVSLHRRLLSGATGETIIGVGGILLLLLSLSGALLWWPGRRNLARGWTIRWKNSRYRVNYDLHRIAGICALLFLSFSALTGAAMVFRPSLERALNRLASAPAPQPKPASTVVEGQRASLDEIIRNADAALPPGELTMINLPATPTAAIVVRKRVAGEMHPSGRSLVYLDQYSGQLLLAENALTAPPISRTFGNLFPLHVGRLGGIVTRLLQLFVGFVPAILFCTGLLMWRSRTRARKKAQKCPPVYSHNEALS